jgi:uncharacterized integral membrane protein
MLTLVITVVLAAAFAIFATQNTGFVEIHLGRYVLQDLPLYLIILLSLIIGLLASYFLQVAYFLSLKLTSREQKDEISKLQEKNAELTKLAHKLEIENTKLKGENGEKFDEDSI